MKRLKRDHRLDKGIKGWIIKTAKKNHWRVRAWGDLEDLIQEGWWCYARCHRKYPGVNQAHFMALVKVSFIHHIHFLALKASRRPDSILGKNSYQDVDQALEALLAPVPEEQTFVTLMGQLPAEIKQLLVILINDAREIPMLINNDGTRETTNQYLWRLLGQKPNGIDLRQAFHEHFTL